MIKKLLIGLALAAAVKFVISKLQASQSEQNLWAEATDSVPPSR
jgi:hypothetical protein